MNKGVTVIGTNKTGKEYLLPTKVMYFPNSDEGKVYIENILKNYKLQLKNTYWFGLEQPEFAIINHILTSEEILKIEEISKLYE